MSHQELIDHAEELADKIVKKFGGSYHWDGDALNYHYSGGVTVCIECTEEEVGVDVKLGLLMSMMKSTFAREIEDYLDKNIH